jgi:hypothetical protein
VARLRGINVGGKKAFGGDGVPYFSRLARKASQSDMSRQVSMPATRT